MEQKGVYKNINETVCVFGLALTAITFNNTPTVNTIADIPVANYKAFDEELYSNYSNATYKVNAADSDMYTQRQETLLERDVRELFGEMRSATTEEICSINNYVKTISMDTGVNFFDLC